VWGVQRYAHKTSKSSSVNRPFSLPSRFFISFKITLLVASVCRLVSGVLDRGCYGFNFEAIVEGLESSVDKMSVIVDYYRVRHSEPADNTSSYEFFHFFGRNGHEWLSLDPFGKIVDSNQEEFCLTLSWGKGTYDVHPLDGERPWGCHAVQNFWLEVV